ncbi:hypothetical protein ACVFI8_18145 [Agarivorans sp. MS3-6]
MKIPRAAIRKITFRYVWNAIHGYLDDKRLHVVAAPGAVKATLGLEVLRVLEIHILVLSPTRIIRDQWIEMLKDCPATELWSKYVF